MAVMQYSRLVVGAGMATAQLVFLPAEAAHAVVRVEVAAEAAEAPTRLPLGGTDADSSGSQSAVSSAAVPSASCLATTLCAVKQRIRWRSAPWKPEYCERLAETILQAAAREKLPPALIVAVMINESSLEERATRVTVRAGVVHAKDGGLMGIRCILDQQGRCTNGKVRGMSWNQVMNPTTNIALGAQALAYWRDVGGVLAEPVRVWIRGDGPVTRYRYRRCPHRDHPYWAHYNHGERYIATGRARNYPHHIAVLYHALARTMEVDNGNLTSLRLGASEPGRQPKRADRPIGPRYHSLYRTIVNLGPVCGDHAMALADDGGAPQSGGFPTAGRVGASSFASADEQGGPGLD